MTSATYETVHAMLAKSPRPSSEVIRYFIDTSINDELANVLHTCKSIGISPATFIEGLTRYLVACIVGTSAPFITSPKGLLEFERVIGSEVRLAIIKATEVMLEKQNAANS